MNTEKHQVLEPGRKEHSRMLFFVVSVSFLFGTIFGSGTWGEVSIIYLLMMCIVVFFLLENKRIYILLFILIAANSGYLLAHRSLEIRYENIRLIQTISNRYIDKIRIVGTIQKELYRDDTSISYRLLVDNFDNISTDRQIVVEQKLYLLVTIPKNLRYTIGDRVSMEGKLMDPKIEKTGFGKYLLLQNISGKIYAGGYNPIERIESSDTTDTLGKSLEAIIFSGFPRDHAGILLGMTVGNTRLMNEKIQENFRNSGLTHILVVSGSNITFLIVMMMGILRYIPIGRLYRMSIVISCILLYGNLVGWEIPVIRATVMGIIAYIGLEHASRFSSMAILFMIAIILILIEPLSLVYDAGFGLSFGATMSIILYGKKITTFLEDHGTPSLLASILSVTLAASIGTLPVMLYHFQSISVGFLVANILVGGVIGWILFFGVGYIILSSIGGILLYSYGYIVYLPLEYILIVAETIGGLGVIEFQKNLVYMIVAVFMAYFLYEILHVVPTWKNQKVHPLKNQEHT